MLIMQLIFEFNDFAFGLIVLLLDQIELFDSFVILNLIVLVISVELNILFLYVL